MCGGGEVVCGMVCNVYGVWCVQICVDVRERAAGAGVERGGDVEVGKVRRSGYTTGGRTRKMEEKVDGLDDLHRLKKGKERIWGNGDRACNTKML